MIHYPVPPHLSECYIRLGHGKGNFPFTEQLASEVLSLPLYNGMTEKEAKYVAEVVSGWSVVMVD